MAVVRNLEIEQVPADTKEVYRDFVENYGAFQNQVGVFAHRPPALKHIMGLLLELADEAVLPKRYLEIALVTVSKLNECEYCVTHHTPFLVNQGFSLETAQKILEPGCPGLDDVDILVRDYAMAVTQNANRIPESMHQRLRKNFSEAQIVELTLRIALCGFFNRFNDALGIATEDDAVAEMLSVTK